MGENLSRGGVEAVAHTGQCCGNGNKLVISPGQYFINNPVAQTLLPFSAPSYYAKLRQQEIERERELAEKYRDRAKERRDGVNKDYEETELISTTANYRAVGPTAEA